MFLFLAQHQDYYFLWVDFTKKKFIIYEIDKGVLKVVWMLDSPFSLVPNYT